MNPRPNQDAAQAVAIMALAFLAEDDDRLGRFMGWTGLDADQVRAAASDPALLGGVLDYLLAHEALLVEFAEHAAIAPEEPARARQALPGYMPPM